MTGGVAAIAAAAQFKPTRERLLKIRGSGDGPSAAQRAKSWFKVNFLGEGGGKSVRCEVSGGDPGYTETAKMLAESALSLAFDKLPNIRSEEHTSELQSLMRNSYAVFCL